MIPQRGGKYKQVDLRKAKKRDAESLSDCRQKAILPRRGKIALSANERIAEFLDFAIQAKFAYVNKLRDAEPLFFKMKKRIDDEKRRTQYRSISIFASSNPASSSRNTS